MPFSQQMQEIGLVESRSKECSQLKGVDDDDLCKAESFERQTSDLCHNSPPSPTQIGAELCHLTQIGLTSQQSGAELCHLQRTNHHIVSRQDNLTPTTDTDRMTQIAALIRVDPFCSEGFSGRHRHFLTKKIGQSSRRGAGWWEIGRAHV